MAALKNTGIRKQTGQTRQPRERCY